MKYRELVRSARARARRARRTAAYTAGEVLMSLAVLAVGIVGIMASEKVTVASNQHAKNLAIATHIAQSWLGMLDAEAALWDTSGGFTLTTWLAQGNGVASWFRPNYSAALDFGPAFDALGNPVTTLNQAQNARFCADLRLSPLTIDNTGGGMIRAEVRVVWLRNESILGGTAVAPTQACSVAAASVDSEDNSRLFHFVYVSSAVRQVGI